MVSVYVRVSSGEKICFTIELDSSVKDLKEMIAESQHIDVEQITLVFKGKILQDAAILSACGLIDASVVHMVVMKKKAPSVPKPAVSQTSLSVPEHPAESSVRTSSAESKPFHTASAPVSSPLSSSFGLPSPASSFRRFGIPSQQSLEAMSPLMASFKDHPELLIQFLKNDPGFRNVLEKNPQMEAMLNDQNTIDYLIDVMSNPDSMRDALRQTDEALNQVGDVPGGEQMLERVMNQYYEPLDKQHDARGFGKEEHTATPSSDQGTLPNLWGSPAPAAQHTSVSSFGGQPPFPFNESTMDENLDMVSRLVNSNPEMFSSLIKLSPEYAKLEKENPLMAQMLTNPTLLKQSLTPENLRMMHQLQQSGLLNGMNPGMGLGQFGSDAPILTSEQIRQKYANEIAQIEAMGFTVDDNVLQTLERFKGNVEMTLNFLLQ